MIQVITVAILFIKCLLLSLLAFHFQQVMNIIVMTMDIKIRIIIFLIIWWQCENWYFKNTTIPSFCFYISSQLLKPSQCSLCFLFSLSIIGWTFIIQQIYACNFESIKLEKSKYVLSFIKNCKQKDDSQMNARKWVGSWSTNNVLKIPLKCICIGITLLILGVLCLMMKLIVLITEQYDSNTT